MYRCASLTGFKRGLCRLAWEKCLPADGSLLQNAAPDSYIMHHDPVSAEISGSPLALKSRIEATKVKQHQHAASADFTFV